jgi:hypothetical protein
VAFYRLGLPPPGTTVVTLTATSEDGDPAIFVGRPGQPIGSDLVAYYDLRSIRPGDEELRIDAATNPSISDYLSNGADLSVVMAATTPGTMTLSASCASGAVLISPFLPNAVVGERYEAKLDAASGVAPYTFTAPEGLPEGLELSSGGVISGRIQQSGLYAVKVQLTDSAGTGETRTLQLWAPEATLLSCGQSTTVQFDTWAFNGQQGLATPGGVFFFNLPVPSGTTDVQLELAHTGDWTLGLFQGIPGELAGSSSDLDYVHSVFDSPEDDPDPVRLTVDAVDLPALLEYGQGIPLALAAQDSFGEATLTATCGYDLALTTRFLPDGAVGTGYQAQIAAAGGTAPYTFALASGALPGGVSLRADGVISGTPEAAGSFAVTLSVTDKNGSSVSRAYSFTVGGESAAAACGQAIPLTCDDFASGTLTTRAWDDRIDVDLNVAGGAAFYCLQFPEESSSVTVALKNNSGDADLFIGYPGAAPGDRDDGHYWFFSSYDGDDALTLDGERYPAIDAYGGLAALTVAAYDPGQFLLSVECR